MKSCTSRLGTNLCTRPAGHVGDHRCYVGDVDDRKAARGEWACAACTHPQAEWRPGEPAIMGTVKEAVCCTIEGRGTCGSPLHIHRCALHQSAGNLLAALRRAQSLIERLQPVVLGESDEAHRFRQDRAMIRETIVAAGGGEEFACSRCKDSGVDPVDGKSCIGCQN